MDYTQYLVSRKHGDAERTILDIVHELTDIERTYRSRSTRMELSMGEGDQGYNRVVIGIVADRLVEMGHELQESLR